MSGAVYEGERRREREAAAHQHEIDETVRALVSGGVPIEAAVEQATAYHAGRR